MAIENCRIDHCMKRELTHKIEDAHNLLCIIVANAKLIPDPAMNGTTDIYAVPMDDIEAAKKLIEQLKG